MFDPRLAVATILLVVAVLGSTTAKATDGSWTATLVVTGGGWLCQIAGPYIVNFDVDNGNVFGSGVHDGDHWIYKGKVRGNSITVGAKANDGSTMNFRGKIGQRAGGGTWSSSAGCTGNGSLRLITASAPPDDGFPAAVDDGFPPDTDDGFPPSFGD